jgi:REP element-mobilizing transposase RayT
MILAFHFIFCAYGFWLPNDPRGSWSTVVRNFDLLAFGPATKVSTTRSVAAQPHDIALRQQAKEAPRYPPVRFTGVQARAIARGFALAAAEADYIIHALAILPEHAHMIMAWHAKHIDTIAAHLKSKATREMVQEGIHPLAAHASATTGRAPSPWARNYWCPFIDTQEYLHRAIRYVEDNPVKAGLRPQAWKCITPHAPVR